MTDQERYWADGLAIEAFEDSPNVTPPLSPKLLTDGAIKVIVKP